MISTKLFDDTMGGAGSVMLLCVKKKKCDTKERTKKRKESTWRERERIRESEKKGKLDEWRREDDATGALEDDSSII